MKAVFFVSLCLTAFSLQAKDCDTCDKSSLPESVRPDSKAMMELKKTVTPSLQAVGRAPAVVKEEMSKEDHQMIFCMKFDQIEGNLVAYTLKEMEATSYSVDETLTKAACQPAKYSAAVKSPIPHLIADDPAKRVAFLNTFWLYYSKKRKEPAKFTELINAKNTQGETLLDYIETNMKEPIYAGIMKPYIEKIVAFACEHGGVYSYYPDKKCP